MQGRISSLIVLPVSLSGKPTFLIKKKWIHGDEAKHSMLYVSVSFLRRCCLSMIYCLELNKNISTLYTPLLFVLLQNGIEFCVLLTKRHLARHSVRRIFVLRWPVLTLNDLLGSSSPTQLKNFILDLLFLFLNIRKNDKFWSLFQLLKRSESVIVFWEDYYYLKKVVCSTRAQTHLL